jgi:hypothetical protein
LKQKILIKVFYLKLELKLFKLELILQNLIKIIIYYMYQYILFILILAKTIVYIYKLITYKFIKTIYYVFNLILS